MIVDVIRLRAALRAAAERAVEKGMVERSQVSINDLAGTVRNVHSGELLAYENPLLFPKEERR